MTIHMLPLSCDPGAPKAIIYSINYKAMSFSAGLCRGGHRGRQCVVSGLRLHTALASLDGGGQL